MRVVQYFSFCGREREVMLIMIALFDSLYGNGMDSTVFCGIFNFENQTTIQFCLSVPISLSIFVSYKII